MRTPVNDRKVDPDFAAQNVGELGIPGIDHSGEAASFWMPKTKKNERWLELKQYPSRYRKSEKLPPFELNHGGKPCRFQKASHTKMH